MRLDIGTAPDSWGVWFPDDPRQIPWRRFLDEVVEAGYEWIELGPIGYLPTDPATLGAELSARGLRATCGFISGALHEPGAWPDLERQAREAGSLLAALGIPNMMPRSADRGGVRAEAADRCDMGALRGDDAACRRAAAR
jgi:inosose dehydratase